MGKRLQDLDREIPDFGCFLRCVAQIFGNLECDSAPHVERVVKGEEKVGLSRCQLIASNGESDLRRRIARQIMEDFRRDTGVTGGLHTIIGIAGASKELQLLKIVARNTATLAAENAMQGSANHGMSHAGIRHLVFNPCFSIGVSSRTSFKGLLIAILARL